MQNQKGEYISRMTRRLAYIFIPVMVLSAAGYILLRAWLTVSPPDISDRSVLQKEAVKVSDSLWGLDSSWLHLNDKGIYELCTRGRPFDRGVIAGKLCRGLIRDQEKVFVDAINKFVPAGSYQRFLRLVIAIFNAGMDKYIPREYLEEIYGLSLMASPEFDYVGPPFDRCLQYHAAHDIGHMLQNYSLVGCTSFAVWGDKSADSSLLVARNFDFSVGDAFAERKVVEFCKPDSGYGFMSISWPGFRGVASGMNEKGLTVTINAAKSAIPFSAAEPVSLIAREILQHAANISEAFAIAQRRKCFVSESYLIGSASDNCAAIIEKSPFKTLLYRVKGEQLICTNHFQAEGFIRDSMNIRHMRRSASVYRYRRVQELLGRRDSLTVDDALEILRDRRGIRDRDIGEGNEKAVNQLIAHHSVIFKPVQGLAWISTSPYQLGSFICYDLNQVLALTKTPSSTACIYKKELTLRPDLYLGSADWQSFLEFRRQSLRIISMSAGDNTGLTEKELDVYTGLNPEYYYTYEICGDYYARKGDRAKAVDYYRRALTKETATLDEKERLEKKLNDCAAGK